MERLIIQIKDIFQVEDPTYFAIIFMFILIELDDSKAY
jgi:hypothetical protein